MEKKKTVCVYCASSVGNDMDFIEMARETGRRIARRQWRLLYGGACCGLMGILADAALSEGGEVHGIIPDFFKDYDFEVIHPNLSYLERVGTMSRRKEMLVAQADAFVTLPGSYGTLDEMFETLVLKQLKHIDKPVFLLNPKGFYDPVLSQLDKMQEAGYLQADNRDLLQVYTNVDDLEKALGDYFGE